MLCISLFGVGPTGPVILGLHRPRRTPRSKVKPKPLGLGRGVGKGSPLRGSEATDEQAKSFRARYMRGVRSTPRMVRGGEAIEHACARDTHARA